MRLVCDKFGLLMLCGIDNEMERKNGFVKLSIAWLFFQVYIVAAIKFSLLYGNCYEKEDTEIYL